MKCHIWGETKEFRVFLTNVVALTLRKINEKYNAKFLMYKIFFLSKIPPAVMFIFVTFYFPSDLKLITMIIFDVDLIKICV